MSPLARILGGKPKPVPPPRHLLTEAERHANALAEIEATVAAARRDAQARFDAEGLPRYYYGPIAALVDEVPADVFGLQVAS